MKKLFSLVLSLFALFAFTSCGGETVEYADANTKLNAAITSTETTDEKAFGFVFKSDMSVTTKGSKMQTIMNATYGYKKDDDNKITEFACDYESTYKSASSSITSAGQTFVKDGYLYSYESTLFRNIYTYKECSDFSLKTSDVSFEDVMTVINQATSGLADELPNDFKPKCTVSGGVYTMEYSLTQKQYNALITDAYKSEYSVSSLDSSMQSEISTAIDALKINKYSIKFVYTETMVKSISISMDVEAEGSAIVCSVSLKTNSKCTISSKDLDNIKNNA